MQYVAVERVSIPVSKTMWTLVEEDGTFYNLYRTRGDARNDKWSNEKVRKVRITLVEED